MGVPEDNEIESGECFLCGEVTRLSCPHCGEWVCSDLHYQYHRFAEAKSLPLTNKTENMSLDDDRKCQPFRLKDGDKGRYLIATRNIPALDLIIRDLPCVVAPPAVTVPVCLECLLPLTRVKHVSPCPRCSAPLCDTCLGGEIKYHVAECHMLSEAGIKLDISDYDENHIFYATILHLRMWRTRQTGSDTWKRINFLQEESNQEYLQQKIWEEVGDYIHKTLNINDISTEEVRRLSGIKNVNACSLTQANDVEGTALYPVYPLMNSYCYCNTMYNIHPDTKVMEVRAKVNIKRGEEITTRYVVPSMEQPTRLEHISKSWGFICSCARCQSPSELGTMFSGVRCGGCDHGYCLPSVSGVLGCDWTCDNCDMRSGEEVILASLARSRAIMGQWTSGEDVNMGEKILTQMMQLLHPNHSLCVQIKTKLVGSYDLVKDRSVEQLDRQLELAEQVLDVMDVIDPGLTPRRGALLKHVLDVKMQKANMDVKEGRIDKKTHLELMRSSMGMMKEVMKCCRYSLAL